MTKLKVQTIDENGVEGFEELSMRNGSFVLNNNGRDINLDMAPRDVHHEEALTNFATGFRQGGFIWRDAMPTLSVSKQSNFYYQWDKEDAYEEGDRNNTSRQGDPPEDTPRLSEDRYEVQRYARSFFLHAETVANADSILNLQLAHMNVSMTRMNLASEIRTQTLLQSPSSFDSSVTLVLDATTTWLNTTTGVPGPNSNPIRDILNLETQVLVDVNQWLMNPIVFNAFIQHPEVQKYFIQKSGTPTIPNEAQIGDLFTNVLGMAPIRKAKAKRLSSGTHPYIWNNSVTGLHVPNGTPTGFDVSTAMRFRWDGTGVSPLKGFTSRDGYFIRTIPIETRGVLGGWKTYIFVYEQEKLISTFGGCLITNAVAAFLL